MEILRLSEFRAISALYIARWFCHKLISLSMKRTHLTLWVQRVSRHSWLGVFSFTLKISKDKGLRVRKSSGGCLLSLHSGSLLLVWFQGSIGRISTGIIANLRGNVSPKGPRLRLSLRAQLWQVERTSLSVFILVTIHLVDKLKLKGRVFKGLGLMVASKLLAVEAKL